MNQDERNVQKAVGLEKEFHVTVEIPVTAVGRVTQIIKAVNKKDAENRMLDMMTQIVSPSQLKKELRSAREWDTFKLDDLDVQQADIKLCSADEISTLKSVSYLEPELPLTPTESI